MPGVHAVIAANDLPDPMRSEAMPMLLPNPSISALCTQHVLARAEVYYVGQPVAVVIADTRYIAEDAAAAVAVHYDALPAVGDCRDGDRGGRAAGPRRARLQCAVHVPAGLRRRRCRLRQRPAYFRGRALAAPRRRHGDRDARGARQPRRRDRHVDGVVGHPDAAYRPPHAGRPARPRAGIDPHDRARRRRRIWAEGDLLSGGSRDPGGGAETRPAGEMDRGPPRAFSVRHPGARPILERRHRGRRGGKNSRRARPHAARFRRLRAVGHHHALHRRGDRAGPLCDPGLSARHHGGAHQQGADDAGARRRPAAGGVRHGAIARPGRARIAARSRRGAAAQFHPAGADALRGRTDVPRRQAADL